MSPRQASSLAASLLFLVARASSAQPADPPAPPSGPPSPPVVSPASPPTYPAPYSTPYSAPPALPISSQRPRWASTDPLVPVGIVVTATGAAFAIPGFLSLAAQRRDPVCGLNGCVASTDYEARAAAGGMLGASAALLLVGLPTLIAGATGEVPEAGARQSPRMAMFGAWLTGYGAGAAAYGFGTIAGAGSNGKVEGVGVALGVGVVGLGMLAAGIPLWAVGTRPIDPSERRASLERPARSEGRMNAGLGLTAAGTVLTATGTMAIVHMAGQSGDFAGLAAAVIGGPVLVGGTILLGVGLPLWLTGSGPLSTGSLLPAIAGGPTSIQLTWRFH